MKTKPLVPKIIAMKTELLVHVGGYKKIAPTSILMLKADVNYTHIYLEDGSQILSSTTIGTLEKRLKEYNFFRTHRSTIINLEYFSDYENLKKSSIIRMKNDAKIPLSRRKTEAFLKIIE